MQDNKVETMVNSTEKDAWTAFKHVGPSFTSLNNEVPNYKSIVANMF